MCEGVDQCRCVDLGCIPSWITDCGGRPSARGYGKRKAPIVAKQVLREWSLNGGRCAARMLQRKFVKVGLKQGPRVMPTR